MPTQYVYSYGDSKKINHSVGYYSRVSSYASNVNITDRPLVVNCAGRTDLPFTFRTHEPNGRHDYYLMYLQGGELDAVVCGKKCRIVPGNAVFFPPEREYIYSKVGENSIQYLWAHFTGYDAGKLLERIGFGECGVFEVGIDSSIALSFMQLLNEFVIFDAHSEEAAAARLTSVIIELKRRMEANEAKLSPYVGRVISSLKFLHENFKETISNERLAQIEHLSVSQYIELFKKCTGLTPRAYLIGLRIQSACDLLLTSDLSVSQIAQTVGYDDSHYFSRIFKANCGISPEKYRLAHGDAPLGTSPHGTSPFGASPFGASPFGTSPFGASPFGASPFGASPFGTSPTGSDRSAVFPKLFDGAANANSTESPSSDSDK